jgi:hypothetical protein
MGNCISKDGEQASFPSIKNENDNKFYQYSVLYNTTEEY